MLRKIKVMPFVYFSNLFLLGYSILRQNSSCNNFIAFYYTNAGANENSLFEKLCSIYGNDCCKKTPFKAEVGEGSKISSKTIFKEIG